MATRGRDGSVGTVTAYGLDGPGIESRWGGETFETPYKLRKYADLLWNKYIFHTLNPFFLILINFQNG
jgi:hypothetical protein